MRSATSLPACCAASLSPRPASFPSQSQSQGDGGGVSLFVAGNGSERRLVACGNSAPRPRPAPRTICDTPGFPGHAGLRSMWAARSASTISGEHQHLRVLAAAGRRPVADVHEPVRRRAPGRPAPGLAARRCRAKLRLASAEPARANAARPLCADGRSRAVAAARLRWRTSSRRSSGLRSCARKTSSPKKNFRRRRRSCSAACRRRPSLTPPSAAW